MSIIAKPRNWHNTEGWVGSDDFDDILDLLDKCEKVDESYDEGGRWSNYRNTVYQITERGQVAYFKLWEEVPASEMQEGGDFMFGLYQVMPVEVTVIQWKPVKNDECGKEEC